MGTRRLLVAICSRNCNSNVEARDRGGRFVGPFVRRFQVPVLVEDGSGVPKGDPDQFFDDAIGGQINPLDLLCRQSQPSSRC
jgi:hypothetical protein